MSDSLTPWTAARQASLSFTISWSFSNSCLLSWWCHPTIPSSVIPFSSHLQSFPASGSFPRSQFFASGGQSIGVSALASVLPMNTQGWFPLGLTGLISLLSKGVSGVFSSTTIRKHQFFGAQPYGPTLTSVCHYWKNIALTRQTVISTWLEEHKWQAWLTRWKLEIGWHTDFFFY